MVPFQSVSSSLLGAQVGRRQRLGGYIQVNSAITIFPNLPDRIKSFAAM
jgi:hypothetical protein